MSSLPDTPQRSDTYDASDLSTDTLRTLVTFNEYTRERFGDFIVEAVEAGHSMDDAEHYALQRLFDAQFYDTSTVLLPADDPAFQ